MIRSSSDRIIPKRGWVYLADLDPAFGTEPGKVRPVLVLQSDMLNGLHPSTTVIPLTTNVIPGPRFVRVHLKKGEGGLTADSDVLVDQPRAIDNRRFKRALGRASARSLAAVERGIAVLLDLPGAV